MLSEAKHLWLVLRSSSRRSLASLGMTLALFSAGPVHAAARIVLDRAEPSQVKEVRGVAEITVIPPFDEAKVSILLDGKVVSSASSAPYSVELDFGTATIEHRIGVVARSRDGKKKSEWSHVVNRGHHPLTISVRLHAAEADAYVEAVCTSPREDPIVAVEFFDGSMIIGTSAKAPHRVSVPMGYSPPVLYATVRTRSGAEETDFLATGADIAVESFQLRTVPIYVSVVDQSGSARSNLKKNSFRILDNGRETRILDFAPAFGQPISIALLQDSSASMNQDMEAATTAATKFLESTLKPKDRLAIFAIRDVPRREQPITPDWKTAVEKLRELKAGGNTAIYDAIACSVRELKEEKNRRAIVIFTDGEDTSSNANFDETLELARRAGIPIYAIAYGPGVESSQHLERLKLLAADTGGFVSIAATNNLNQKFEQIARDLRAQYAIRYQVGDNSKSNQWRPIKVVVNSPKLTARTIKGYFTP